jgi:hypothetical protein
MEKDNIALKYPGIVKELQIELNRIKMERVRNSFNYRPK